MVQPIKRNVKLGIPADSLDKGLKGCYLTKVFIKIDKIYKGQTTVDTLTIYIGMGGGDSGFRFKEGQKYIIYGKKHNYLKAFFKEQKFPDGQNIYWTNKCTRTQEHNRNEVTELERLSNKK